MGAVIPEIEPYDSLTIRFLDLFIPIEYDLLFEVLRVSDGGGGFINRMETTWNYRCADIREIRTIDTCLAHELWNNLRSTITQIFLHLARIHRVYSSILPNQSKRNFSTPEQFMEAIIASMNDWDIRNRIYDQLDSLTIGNQESQELYRDLEGLYTERKN